MAETETITTGNHIIVPRPPFVGRYFYYNGKKYLFTHRHPKEQKYWSDEIKVTSGNHYDYGAWIPTDKLTPA